MNRCPITYERLPSAQPGYSRAGLRRLSRSLNHLEDLAYSAEEQRREARARAAKLSIQGVQPKLSARLAVRRGRFELVDRGGTYILKPQTGVWDQVPENEDVTMRLAAAVGIEVPLHGLIRSKDGSFTYFVRRFDRRGRGEKVAVEDFAQLAGETRDTKYRYSMERLVGILERFCTFPAVDKLELFRRTVFCYLAGNEDMHLKNFSLLVDGDVVKLAPAYDLVNTALVVDTPEELALPLNGKKSGLIREDLVDYFGSDRLALTPASVREVLNDCRDAAPAWLETIEASFLSDDLKRAYRSLLSVRISNLRLG